MRNIFLAWMFFNAHNKGVATKLVEKIVTQGTPCVLRLLVETYWLVETFLKIINTAFRNKRTINILIRRGWASYCAIIGGFQLSFQDKLFPSLRSSRSYMFFKVGALKNFAMFRGKHLCWSPLLINFIKKELQHRCFPVSISNFLRTAFFIEHLPWLFLII